MVPFPTSDADPGAQGQARKIATYSLYCECRQCKMGRQKMKECGKCKRLFHHRSRCVNLKFTATIWHVVTIEHFFPIGQPKHYS